MKHTVFYIIDFDSTFVTVEALDELAKISLVGNPKQDKIVSDIATITREGMEGKIPFAVSLKKRVRLLGANKQHIATLSKKLAASITPSVQRNKDFFKSFSERTYIISGGFSEYIVPIVSPFGIHKSHVLANRFLYDKKGNITGYDRKNPLSKNEGKVRAVESLGLKGEVIVLGDGITDYQIKERGKADTFFAFTENVRRSGVVVKADGVVSDFDEFLYLQHLPRKQSYPKSRMKVLLLEKIDQRAVDKFQNDGFVVETVSSSLDESALKKAIADVSVLGIRSKTELSKLVLENAKKLLAVGAYCIGTNQIDLQTCSERGIAVFNAPYSNTRSVVELALGNIIMLYRKAVDKSVNLHKGIWDKSASGCFEVRGKKLGIIGYGNIGTQLGILAEDLGMDVYFYDIVDKLALGNAKRCASLGELLQMSDVITVHVDGRKSNKNLITKYEFEKMKKGVIFLNLSRGFIVDIIALADAVKRGIVAGCAVDVFPEEPKSNTELFVSVLQGLPNTILTPHIGGSTEEAQKNIGEFVTGKLVDFINNGTTTLSVNFPTIQLPPQGKSHRLIHLHKNTPGLLASINTILAKHMINVEAQFLKTNDAIGYVITDVNRDYGQDVLEELRNIKGTIRLRVLY
ncbi:MAG: phosphoglycerate dehydrogenase [bacterium]|nr:phosphoglycerate dehydrogenase [bacterium]